MALNTVSAALVPRASEDNSLAIAGIRLADVLVVFAIGAALLGGVPRGGYLVWGILTAWLAWTVLAALELGSDEFSLYRSLAEWQIAVYLVACWLVISALPHQQWSIWSLRTVRTQVVLVIIGAVWAAITGRAGADIATIACVVAMLALAVPRITSWERIAVMLAALVLVIISGQRAAILLSLLPILAATAFWLTKLSRAKLSAFLTTLLVGAAILAPLSLAVRLDRDLSRQVSEYIDRTFFREAKQLSIESRLVSWRVALSDLGESPVFGQGVGGTVIRYRDPGVDLSAVTNITHNTLLDFALRFGAPVGILITATLVVLVVSRIAESWKVNSYAMWICAWALGGLLAKGMVESVFFKPRLVPLLALLTAVLLIQNSRPAYTNGSPRSLAQRVREATPPAR